MERLLQETIDTARLRLRPPVDADARLREVCRYMIWSPHDSLEVTRSFIGECLNAWKGGARLPYVITLRESQDPIGMIEARIQNIVVDIGYVLARPRWGNGFMPEAIRALAAAALSHPRLFRIQAFCDVANIPSQRALEKAGFLREGRMERYLVHPNLSPELRPCFVQMMRCAPCVHSRGATSKRFALRRSPGACSRLHDTGSTC